MEKESTIAVQALWLQYKGLTIEAFSSRHRIENAAWNRAPPPRLEDVPEIGGLMVAS